jgi:hypothetical protein
MTGAFYGLELKQGFSRRKFNLAGKSVVIARGSHRKLFHYGALNCGLVLL